jgi:hypothetical protein
MEMIVWYDIETDELFTSNMVDAMFYALEPLLYDRLIVAGFWGI